MKTVDEAHWFLHAAGFSVTEARVGSVDGAVPWLVTASDGRHHISASAETQTEAWRAAAEQVAELVENVDFGPAHSPGL